MKRFLMIVPIVLFIFLNACGISSNPVSPDVGTFVAQTQTATMWTATPVLPSPTLIPKESVIVDTLNSALRGVDPLDEAIDAKFFISDLGFDTGGNPPVIVKMRIHIECEWILHPTCTPERGFVNFMHVFEMKDVRKKIIEQIPATVESVQIESYDHMVQIGSLSIGWQDMMAFVDGDITGDQLAARVNRSNP